MSLPHDTPAKALTLRFKRYTMADAFNTTTQVDWVIDGLFSAGSVNVLSGAPGAKKTYSLIDAGMCVALGVPWLDRPTTQGQVLFVDEESGSRRLGARLAACARGHDADESTPITYTSLALLNLRTPADGHELEALIRDVGARLVIIDALADIMPGADENAVKDVQPVFLTLRGIADRTRSAIDLIHHNNKAGGYRGSTAIAGAADLVLIATSKPDSPNIDFTFDKARDVSPFPLAAVAHFEPDQFWLTPSARVAAMRPISKAQKYVVRYLQEHGDSPMSEIMAHADVCSAETARRTVYALSDRGYVRRVDDGSKGEAATYGLTASGRALLPV